MGILNITPDSFFDGNKYFNVDSAVERAVQMYEEGADIIDVGGESTRPGSLPVSSDEELERILKPVELIKQRIPVSISIDTYKSEVAEEACRLGIEIINDISGLRFDPKMVEVAKKYNTKVVIMHIKGTPKDMQVDPFYEDVILEIKQYFQKQIEYAKSHGIQQNNMIIDPGIGFGKRLEDNLHIIRNLSEFKDLNCPILIGVSRKSFLGKILDVEPEDRLEGTIASSLLSFLNGADILRVHDVKEVVRALKVTESIIYS